MFKKSNSLIGSLNCINGAHLFPDKTFKLYIYGSIQNKVILPFNHECDYCPCCYSYYYIILEQYEHRYNMKNKLSENSKQYNNL